MVSKRKNHVKPAMSVAKQVRYVSRKRLAEARPRVRGQFVKAEVAAAFFAAQKARYGRSL